MSKSEEPETTNLQGKAFKFNQELESKHDNNTEMLKTHWPNLAKAARLKEMPPGQ